MIFAFLVLMGIAGILALGKPPVLGQEPVDDPAGVVDHQFSSYELSSMKQFWDREKFESAIPMDTIEVAEASIEPDELSEDFVIPFEAVAGQPPKPGATDWARKTYPLEWLAIANAVEKGSGELDAPGSSALDSLQATEDERFQDYPPAYNSFFVNRFVSPLTLTWWLYPWSTMGRLFFTKPGSSTTFVCTASAYARRAIWTTGHCVYSPGVGWHQNMVFIPAYRDGTAPYGQWMGIESASTSGWINNGNLAYDLGVVLLADQPSDDGGEPQVLGDVIGTLGTAWGGPIQRLFNRFGYPANFESGKYLYQCQGSLSATRTKTGPDPFAIGCDMLGGSSGGPYIYKYAPYFSLTRNFVNGVHGFHISGSEEEGYSPYFGEAAENLFNWGNERFTVFISKI